MFQILPNFPKHFDPCSNPWSTVPFYFQEADHAKTLSLETKIAVLKKNRRLVSQVARHAILSGILSYENTVIHRFSLVLPLQLIIVVPICQPATYLLIGCTVKLNPSQIYDTIDSL